MEITLAILAFLFAILGIVGSIVPVLPGPAISFVGLLLAYFSGYADYSTMFMLIWLVVIIVISVLDYIFPRYMVRFFGGSRAGEIGATVGLVGGSIFFGFVGTILGPFFGAVLGELTREKRDVSKAFKVGFSSFLSFIIGTGIKLGVAIAVLISIGSELFPVVRDWVVSLF